MDDVFDLAVIGGGVNGAGIARDAAGRGAKVLLLEAGDLAQGTSSASTKLIHGGLRYLEHYEFSLVRESLSEREALWKIAPHIIWPLRFVLPHVPGLRPRWLLRLGLFLYDHIGGRKRLPATRSINLARHPAGGPLKPGFHAAFEYSDGWVDDARLVALNAKDAAEHGAEIRTRCAVTAARREDGHWRLETPQGSFRAKALVNAAGPWVENVINAVAGSNSPRRVRLVKGSHVIVRKFWDGPHAYLLQNHDGRVIFVNPYQGDLCLIGTTDIAYNGRAEDVKIDDDEIHYLLAAVNRYTKQQLAPTDIIASFAGVRPLYDDNAANPSAVTRDYVFDVEGAPPLLSVFGGKLTTYRKLAEHALLKLKPFFPAMKDPWTAAATLPGGDMPEADFEKFLAGLQRAYPRLPGNVVLHYARLYGTRAPRIMGDLGEHFGGTLYRAEIDYLCQAEWAKTAADILDRRTKHGLRLTAPQRARVAAYLNTST